MFKSFLSFLSLTVIQVKSSKLYFFMFKSLILTNHLTDKKVSGFFKKTKKKHSQADATEPEQEE